MARRTREEALQTREHILDAAIEVFHERGVARPSLTEIAKLAGVTRGAIYGHFQNKADLFAALCARIRLPTETIQDPDSPACQNDPLGKLRRAWVGFFKQAAADAKLRRVLDIILHRCELVEESGMIQQRMQEGHQRSLEAIAILLQRAAQRNQLPADLDVPAATNLLHASLVGVLSEWLFNPENYDLAERAEAYVDSLLEMLRQSPALRLSGGASATSAG